MDLILKLSLVLLVTPGLTAEDDWRFEVVTERKNLQTIERFESLQRKVDQYSGNLKQRTNIDKDAELSVYGFIMGSTYTGGLVIVVANADKAQKYKTAFFVRFHKLIYRRNSRFEEGQLNNDFCSEGYVFPSEKEPRMAIALAKIYHDAWKKEMYDENFQNPKMFLQELLTDKPQTPPPFRFDGFVEFQDTDAWTSSRFRYLTEAVKMSEEIYKGTQDRPRKFQVFGFIVGIDKDTGDFKDIRLEGGYDSADFEYSSEEKPKKAMEYAKIYHDAWQQTNYRIDFDSQRSFLKKLPAKLLSGGTGPTKAGNYPIPENPTAAAASITAKLVETEIVTPLTLGDNMERFKNLNEKVKSDKQIAGCVTHPEYLRVYGFIVCKNNPNGIAIVVEENPNKVDENNISFILRFSGIGGEYDETFKNIELQGSDYNRRYYYTRNQKPEDAIALAQVYHNAWEKAGYEKTFPDPATFSRSLPAEIIPSSSA